MSTIKAANIVNPSSASTNLALDTSGNVAIQAGTAAAPALYVSGDSNTGIYSPGADSVAITTGGSARLTVDSSGRALVGTSSAYVGYGGSSSNKIQIAGSAYTDAGLSAFVFGSTPVGGYLNLGLSRNTTVGSHTVVQSGDALGAITFNGSDGTTFKAAADINCYVDGTPGTNDMPGRLVFSTTADGASSPTERMRISNSGAVLLSGPSANTVAFTLNSAVAGTSGGNYPLASINSTGSGDSGAACLHLGKSDNSTSTSNVFQRFYINSAGTGSGQINANGASAAAFGTFSDERLKENISELPSQLQNICALRPVEFDYKDGSGHQIGFIAQEMQSVYPDVVGETEGMLTVTGWSKTEARLVKALQEAIAKIEILEVEVAALKAQ